MGKNREFSNEEMNNKIQKVFIELYAKENFNKISVKNVCSKSNISRTTFYNYYDDLYEVLGNIEDKLIFQLKEINQSFDKQDFKRYRVLPFDFFYDTLLFIKKDSK